MDYSLVWAYIISHGIGRHPIAQKRIEIYAGPSRSQRSINKFTVVYFILPIDELIDGNRTLPNPPTAQIETN